MLIRALNVKRVADGLFEIIVPSRDLSANERQVLTELFPNLVDQVHTLLQKEALLEAVVADSYDTVDHPIEPPSTGKGKKTKKPTPTTYLDVDRDFGEPIGHDDEDAPSL